MNGVIFALVGAAVALVFAVQLWRQWLDRGRNHALAWALALSLYAFGMVVLATGFAAGWSATLFGMYWVAGALLTAPLLGIGQLHLLDPRRAMLWWTLGGLAVAWAIAATALSSFDPAALRAASDAGGIPTGAEVFADQPAYMVLRPLTFGGLLVVLGGCVWSALASRRWAVLLIALGVVVAGSSSSFVRSGLDALVPVALALGVTVMYVGFRAATRQPRSRSESRASTR